MQRKLIFITMSLFLTAIFSSINNAQVVEKDGVFYRDFILNPASDIISDLAKPDEITSAAYNEPPIIKPDFMVNTTDGEYGADQTAGSTASDGDGNFAITWIDFRDGQKAIYTQFFNSSGDRVGTNFKVNDEALTGNNSPSIAANKNGDFVIVWLKNFGDVMCQRVTKDGLKIGNNIKVNIFSGWNTREPSAAVNSDGSFMVTWAFESGDWNYQVYARHFDSNGNPLGPDKHVSDPSTGFSSVGHGKNIAVDDRGYYCLTWSSYGGGNKSKIYLQLFNSLGQVIGTRQVVNGSNDSTNSTFPQITSTNDGHFLLIWQISASYPEGGGIGARIFHSDNYFVNEEFLFFSHQNSWTPNTLASDKDSTFYVHFLGNGSPYIKKLFTSGEYGSDTIRVTYNSTEPFYSYSFSMTDVINNTFYLIAGKYDKNDQNIYKQKFDSGINPIDPLEKIHDDPGSAWQRKPLVHYNNKGEFIVLWEDKRNGRYDLYAQVFDENSNPVGDNIQINDANSEYWFLSERQISSFQDGTFAIVFCGSDLYYGHDILLQYVGISGEKIGQNKLIKERYYNYRYKISFAINENDEMLICWYEYYSVNIRKYSKSFVPLLPEKQIISSVYPVSLNPMTVSIDSGFNIMAVWRNYNMQTSSYDNKILAKFFDSNGNANSEIFIIDSTTSYIQNLISKNDNRNYAVAYKYDGRVYLKRKYFLDKEYTFNNVFNSYSYTPIQLNIVEFKNQKVFITYNSPLDVIGFYSNDNKRKSDTFLLHQYDYIDTYTDYYNGSNSTSVYGENFVFTFESGKNGGTGYDIWANVRKLEDINFTDEYFYPPVNGDVLYTNFPNPFNLKTKISYELIAYGKVKLSVYDILGREVKILVDDYQESGVYEVDFDASGLASGIYIYRLEAFNPITKKMILLK